MSKKFRTTSNQRIVAGTNKRVTSSQSVNRPVPGLTPPPKKGATAVGIIGWLAAVAGIITTIAILIAGNNKLADARLGWERQVDAFRNNAKAELAKLGDVAEVKDEASELRDRSRDLTRELNELKLTVRRLQRQQEADAQGLKLDQEQLTNQMLRLGIEQPTFAEFEAHYNKTIAAREAEEASRAEAERRRVAAERARAEAAAAARRLANATQERENTAEPEVPESEQYIKPDERFIRVNVSSRRKRAKADNGDKDDTMETISVKVDIKNGHFQDSYNACSLYVIVIGEYVNDRQVNTVLEKHRLKVNLESRSDETHFEHELVTIYDDNDEYKYGYKYDSYLVVLCDQEGNPVVTESPRSSFKANDKKIMALNSGDTFDRNGERVRTPRAIRVIEL